MLYDIIKPQSDSGFGALTSNLFPQAGSGSGVTYVERELSVDDTILPPFWPTLATDAEGASFTFTITDGFVVDHRGGNGMNGELRLPDPYYPSGISTEVEGRIVGGKRIEVPITAGEQISIKVALSKDGQVNTVSLVVEDENTISINPDPTAFAGLGASGEFNYKIAVLRAAVGDAPAYLDYYLAGSHIYLRHRGHNLNQRVYIVTICGGVLANASNHYLCWRNGDYVGKFLSTDTLPAYTGSLDATDVTYLSAVS